MEKTVGSPYIQEMLQRDLEEKKSIQHAVSKLTVLQVIVSIIGFFLVCSLSLNIYFTNLAINGIEKNRKTTIENRAYGDSIIKRQTVIMHKLDSVIDNK